LIFPSEDGVCLRKAISFFSALRPTYWFKNTLIFVPALLGNGLKSTADVMTMLGGFFIFSLCASVGYLINDLADQRQDALHPAKSKRGLANGDVKTGEVFVSIIGLAIMVFLAAFLAQPHVFVVLAGYLLGSIVYTFFLKHFYLLDCLTLSLLHICRIWFGSVLIGVPLAWSLIAFSALFFFSLALAKRYSELQALTQNSKPYPIGRPYTPSDGKSLAMIGQVSAFFAALVLVLYALDVQYAVKFYPRPNWLWGAVAIVTGWIAYLWQVARRGNLTDDPIQFAIKDRHSLLCLVGLVVTMVLAKGF
jgi:4-hydroxybenzoate polyprenyltransferase